MDYRRLGKQRVECKQIINILDGVTPNARWKNHPAVLMWAGYTDALKEYANIVITEWIARGYKNTMPLYQYNEPVYPWWLGNEDFHRAMRSRLIEKKESYYLPLFGEIDKNFNNANYFWPVNESKTFKLITKNTPL